MGIERLNQTLSLFEKELNLLGYIPVVSTFSGAVRITYGKLEVIAGLASSIFWSAKGIGDTLTGDDKEAEKSLDNSIYSINYSLHGAANIFRGSIEIIPFIGNALTLIYDASEPLDRTFDYSPTWQNRNVLVIEI